MTVATTNNYVTATGNGATTIFPYTFRMLDVSHMVVTVAGVVAVSGYTVSINSNGVGGNVTFSVAPANLAEIILERSVPITQGLDLEIEEQLPESEIEEAYDRLTVICQQLQDQLDRAFTLNIVDSLGVSLQLPAPVAGYGLFWNDDGDALISSPGTPGEQGPPGSLTGPATTVIGNVPIFADTVGGEVSDSGVAISGLGTWVIASAKSGTWSNNTSGSNVSYPVNATSATICNLVAATGSGKVSRFAITTGSGGLTINRNGSDTIDYLGTSTTNITMARTTSGVLDLQDVAAGLWRVV